MKQETVAAKRFCRSGVKLCFGRGHEFLSKYSVENLQLEIAANANRNKVTRQLFEGAKPTLEKLAIVSNRAIIELKVLSTREHWVPLHDAAIMKRRLAGLSDRVMALMEEPDEDALLSKSRLDAITSLLKAIDRLKAAISDLGDEVSDNNDEAAVTNAFELIDQRIEDLAEAYAKKLVESQSETRTD